MDSQRVSYSTWIPGNYVKGTLKLLNKWPIFRDGLESRPARSTCENGTLVRDYKQRTRPVTWVEEDGALLIRNSRGVLDHRQTCRSSGAVVIIHWNLEVPASQVWICGIYPEAPTGAPRNLEDIQEDRRDRDMGIKLTVASVLRGVGAGAVTTCFASKPRVSKVVRPVERSISLVGVFSPPRDFVYIVLGALDTIGAFIPPMGRDVCGIRQPCFGRRAGCGLGTSS